MPPTATALAMILAASLALPLAAQDHVGSFSGTVDGEAREWHLVVIDGEASSHFMDFGMIQSASVFGYPDPQGREFQGAIEFSLSFVSGAGSSLASAEIVFFSDSLSSPYVQSVDRGGPMEVSIDTFEEDGDNLRVTGNMAAQLFRMVSMASEELDEDDAVAVTLSFDLTLPEY